MRDTGLKLKAKDIYNPDKASLKDAVCQFGGGCTAEVVSPEGLILTNHHCGFGAIQRLSSLENNYIEDGFWAMKKSEELPADGITATFIVRMEDVTYQALQFVRDDMPESERQSQIDKNINKIKSDTRKERWQELEVSPFYGGNKYYLFVKEVFKDVRLVGTPPSSIGKFGADTDNWVWPRHTGDFSVFRIYADKDNRPAEYSDQNRPYTPKHHFPVSIGGIKEGDFTMVFGFPGRTQQYLPGEAVDDIANVYDPLRIGLRDKALDIMDEYMRNDPAIRLKYVSKFAGIANGWKKWIGESKGINSYGALEKKAKYEADFTRALMNDEKLNNKYGQVLPRLNGLYAEIEPVQYARDAYLEVFVRNTEAPQNYFAIERLMRSKEQGTGQFMAEKEQLKKRMEGFFKDYEQQVDKAVFAALAEMYAKDDKIALEYGRSYVIEQADAQGGYSALADHLYANSALGNAEKMDALLSIGSVEEFETALEKDPFIAFSKTLLDNYRAVIAPKYEATNDQINALERQYMAAQMEAFPKKAFFPDANSTLRLTYGKVKGYQPRDAVYYLPFSYLKGVVEKYVPGDYEFDVPQKLLDLYKAKNFGRYADKTGDVPVGLIGTNHTTGGNSGSPALNAKGELVGINFDRVWEGTMSDLNHDPEICRNIMVDIRYVLFVIDKFAGAGHLVEEMTVRD